MNDTTKNTVILINYVVSHDAIAAVHRIGCKDIKKTMEKHCGSMRNLDLYGTEYPSLEAALSSFIDAEMLEMGWTRDCVHVFNCAKGN